MNIEVCGRGCLRCYTTYWNVGLALRDLGIKESAGVVKATHIKDPELLAERGVQRTPSLLIDGGKMSEDRIPEVKEIKQWIEERLP